MRDSFVISSDHAEIVSELTDEQAGKVFKALFEDDPDLSDTTVRIVYKTINSQIRRYEEIHQKRSEAGANGNRKRWGNASQMIANDRKVSQTVANASQMIAPIPIPKPIPEKEKTPKGVQKKFIPPTVDEVKAYVDHQGYKAFNAEHFIDFYASKGWMVGKNHMKDWKAAARNWNRSQRQEVTAKGRQEKTVNNFNNFPQRKYDYDDLESKMLAAQNEMFGGGS